MTEQPFSGSIEFKLGLRAFEQSVVRDASAIYAYTPAWPLSLPETTSAEDKRCLELRILGLSCRHEPPKQPGLQRQ